MKRIWVYPDPQHCTKGYRQLKKVSVIEISINDLTPWSYGRRWKSPSPPLRFPLRKFNLIKRRAVYIQNVYSFSSYNLLFNGFKSAINIRQMQFMNPLKPTPRHGVKELHSYGRTSFPSLYKFKFSLCFLQFDLIICMWSLKGWRKKFNRVKKNIFIYFVEKLKTTRAKRGYENICKQILFFKSFY